MPKLNASDVYNFAVHLRNYSDSNHEYVAMLQTIFCPEQPICTGEGVEDSYDILKNLPAALTVDDKTLRVEDIKDFIGICCLPCSCSETCKEDDNCCPTKYYTNYTRTQDTVKRECISANVKVYRKAGKVGLGYSEYFMTTQCFEDRSNSSLVSKCENPDIFNIDETVPVTSVSTGHTYWNKHCAACNGDINNLKQWDSKLNFAANIFTYFDAKMSGLLSMVNSLEELHGMLARRGEIFYTPPVSMEHNRCFEKRYADNTCAEKEESKNKTRISFIRQACQRFYNPVYAFLPRRIIYLNFFCFLCKIQIVKMDKCSLDDAIRGPLQKGQMTALLDYKTTSETILADTHRPHREEKQETCPCDKVYDHYKVSMI